MKKFARKLLLGVILSQPALWAVYAPIPEQEQGKAWTATLRTGASYDSNLFGAAVDETGSSIVSATAKIAFNASLTQQTFGSAYYQATLDHYFDRPGSKDLPSHELMGRLAHAFTPTSTIDLMDFFQIAKNPESLLSGLPLNTNQSFQRNQADIRYSCGVTQKGTLSVKYRNVLVSYEDASLGANLDHMENLVGLAGSYGVLPEIQAVAEYRRQKISYDHDSSTKDKDSDFFLLGADHKASEKLTISGRLGVEWRRRESERSVTAPSAELSLKYDFAPLSYVSIGYTYALEEASNIATYTDSKVNRFFVNVQKSLTQTFVGSASVTCEPAVLQGRRVASDTSETTYRFGASLSYLPSKNWSVSLSYDYDRVISDEAMREMVRNRVALSAAYTF